MLSEIMLHYGDVQRAPTEAVALKRDGVKWALPEMAEIQCRLVQYLTSQRGGLFP